MAVIGLMTQLKISFRQISILMLSGDAAVEPGRRQQRRRSPRCARSASSSVAPARGEVDDAGLAEDGAELRDGAQHEASAADFRPHDVLAAQPVLDAQNHGVVAQLVAPAG